jgi:hypothetical protein
VDEALMNDKNDQKEEQRLAIIENAVARENLIIALGGYLDCAEEELEERVLSLLEYPKTLDRLSKLLKEIAIALKGPEPELISWDWADLPELVAAAVKRLEKLEDREGLALLRGHPLTTRERHIVKLAAAEPTLARDWFERDERGTWEKTAGDLLEKTKDRAVVLKMDEAAVDRAIAAELVIMALEALLKSAERMKKHGR